MTVDRATIEKRVKEIIVENLELDPDIYDIVFTPAGTQGTVIARLDNQDLGATGIFSFLIVDTDDVNVADVILYDDVPP